MTSAALASALTFKDLYNQLKTGFNKISLPFEQTISGTGYWNAAKNFINIYRWSDLQ